MKFRAIIICIATVLFFKGCSISNFKIEGKEAITADNIISESNNLESEKLTDISEHVIAIDEKFGEVINYLILEVPEISEFEKKIDELSNGDVTLIMRLDGFPISQLHSKYNDYYIIYVGENHDEYTVKWNSFYVRKDLKEILAEDVVTGEIIPIIEWRELKKARGF